MLQGEYDESSSSDEESASSPELSTHQEIYPMFTDILNATLNPTDPSIHILTDDCLDNVFTYLDFVDLLRVCVVCRRWYNACTITMGRTTKLELNPTFSIFRINTILTPANFLSLLLRTRDSIQHLDVSHSSLRLSSETCNAISKHCPNLALLNLSKLKINRKISLCFRHNLPLNVTHLILNGCVSLKEQCLKNILMKCHHLEHLDLSLNHRINGKCIVNHLAKNKMKYFDFSECYNLQPGVLVFVLTQYRSTLEYLNISRCDHYIMRPIKGISSPLICLNTFIAQSIYIQNVENHDFYIEKLIIENFQHLLKLMPQIQELNCSGNVVGDASIFSVLSYHCPHLKRLDISYMSICSTDQLHTLSSLHNLTELSISGISDDFDYEIFVETMLNKLHNLESLVIKSSHLNDDNISSIIHNLVNLVKLDIRSSAFGVYGDFITKSLSLDRQHKIEIFAQDTFIDPVNHPVIPDFMNIHFSIRADDYSARWGMEGEFGDNFELFDDLNLGDDADEEGHIQEHPAYLSDEEYYEDYEQEEYMFELS